LIALSFLSRSKHNDRGHDVSIEQRHMQIREKAGLEDSRLNKEFIGFLQKWSTPLMAIIAVAALGYVGLGKLREQRTAKVEAAFREFQSVTLGGTLNASPDSLIGVADAYDDVPGVAILARLGAADALLQSVRTGLRPGAVLKPDNTLESTDDLLSDADRESALTRAAGLYRQVLDRTSPVPGQQLHAIGALYGLATVESMKGDAAAAKAHLERVKSMAENSGFELHVKIAEARLAALDAPSPTPQLISQSELPQPPAPPELPMPLVPEPGSPGDVAPDATPATEPPAAPPVDPPAASGDSASDGDPKPAAADGPK
jgi:hypothetical protein